MPNAFSTPLKANYAPNDTGIAGAVNDASKRINDSSDRYSETTGLRNLSGLIGPSFTTTEAYGFKQGLVVGLRAVVTVATTATKSEWNVLEGLPTSWRSQTPGAVVGIARSNFHEGLHLLTDSGSGGRLYLRRADGTAFELTAGTTLGCEITTWSWLRGTAAEIPGTAV